MQFNAHGDIVCRRCPAHESISQPGLVHGFLLTGRMVLFILVHAHVCMSWINSYVQFYIELVWTILCPV